ncbi:polyprenyl synthetase family protein [Streptomyces sp. NPDC056632]|uniref:polyprenyl synthetase family protein n=1 Tax=Streptomyces sp. NPDC056632 TaxID=3345884 RepID=UPI00369AD144
MAKDTRRFGRRPFQPTDFQEWMTDVRKQVDSHLAEFLASRRSFLAELGVSDAGHALESFVLDGGKRTRPAFCHLGWLGAAGADEDALYAVAAALELFHAFALQHDDLIDNSATRRGRPAQHRRLAALHADAGWLGSADEFGAATAMLLGDLSLVWADELFESAGLPPDRLVAARRLYHRMRSEAVAGELLEVRYRAEHRRSVQRSLLTALFKGARYTIEQPLRLGGVVAGADASLLDFYSDFGVPLGVAFQLRDDLLGAFGSPQRTGKPVTDDFREGKPTVLFACAWEAADSQQRKRLTSLYGRPGLDDGDAREIRNLMRATGAVRRVEELIDHRVKRALWLVESAPVPEEIRPAFTHLALAAVHRDH